MLSWKILPDNKRVELTYPEGNVTVSKEDFDRAFGAMLGASYEDVKRDFGIA